MLRHKTVNSGGRVRKNYAVDGKNGADAERYDEANLREALRAAEEARKQQP
jgi:hypothetical protein